MKKKRQCNSSLVVNTVRPAPMGINVLQTLELLDIEISNVPLSESNDYVSRIRNSIRSKKSLGALPPALLSECALDHELWSGSDSTYKLGTPTLPPDAKFVGTLIFSNILSQCLNADLFYSQEYNTLFSAIQGVSFSILECELWNSTIPDKHTSNTNTFTWDWGVNLRKLGYKDTPNLVKDVQTNIHLVRHGPAAFLRLRAPSHDDECVESSLLTPEAHIKDVMQTNGVHLCTIFCQHIGMDYSHIKDRPLLRCVDARIQAQERINMLASAILYRSDSSHTTYTFSTLSEPSCHAVRKNRLPSTLSTLTFNLLYDIKNITDFSSSSVQDVSFVVQHVFDSYDSDLVSAYLDRRFRSETPPRISKLFAVLGTMLSSRSALLLFVMADSCGTFDRILLSTYSGTRNIDICTAQRLVRCPWCTSIILDTHVRKSLSHICIRGAVSEKLSCSSSFREENTRAHIEGSVMTIANGTATGCHEACSPCSSNLTASVDTETTLLSIEALVAKAAAAAATTAVHGVMERLHQAIDELPQRLQNSISTAVSSAKEASVATAIETARAALQTTSQDEMPEILKQSKNLSRLITSSTEETENMLKRRRVS